MSVDVSVMSEKTRVASVMSENCRQLGEED